MLISFFNRKNLKHHLTGRINVHVHVFIFKVNQIVKLLSQDESCKHHELLRATSDLLIGKRQRVLSQLCQPNFEISS